MHLEDDMTELNIDFLDATTLEMAPIRYIEGI
jgi:hypothetical protein